MTLGKREYSEADMLKMQRDAEERVREMQARARGASGQEPAGPTPSRNRNWNSGPNTRRNGMRRPDMPYQNQDTRRRRPEPEPEPEPVHPEPEHVPDEPKKPTTVVEDVMGALNLDEDYLLIIGLLLILINQRADTTLILALAYLLI